MVDFPIRVVVKAESAQRGAGVVNKSLSSIENRANKLRETLQKTFTPVRLQIERASLRSSRIQIAGVANQVSRLRSELERSRLTRFQRGLRGIGTAANRAGRRLRELGRNMLRTTREAATARRELGGLRSILGAFGTAAIIGGVVSTGRSFQQLQLRIRSVSETAQDFEQNFSRIQQVSDRTGTSLAQNAQVFARLRIATRNLGVSAERTAGLVQTLNQAFIVGGSGAQETRSAITQLSQALASGRLQGDELRSLLENAPLLAENLATQLGVTVGELREMGATGELTGDRLIEALEGAAGAIDERFRELGPTFDQSVERLRNSITELGRSVQPLIEGLTRIINLIAGFASRLSDLLDQARRLRALQGDIAQNEILSEEGRARTQTLRLGNISGLFEGGEAGLGTEEINRRATALQGRLQAAGLRAENIRLLVNELTAAGATAEEVTAKIDELAPVIENVANATIGASQATTDFVSSQKAAKEAEEEAAAAKIQAGVATRRATRTLRAQIEALKGEAELLKLSDLERETQEQRLRAEEALRRKNIEVTDQGVQALLNEVEALARANAERRQEIELEKQRTADAERTRNEQLALRKQLLDQIRTPEEERAALTAQVEQLSAAGIINDAERNRLLAELPGLLDESTNQFGSFIDQLVEARDQANKLGEAFGGALRGAIGRASNALAEFVVNGADDIESLRESLSNILKDLAQQILAAIIQAVILRALVGEGGGGGGGFGGLLGLIPGLGPTGARRTGGAVSSGRGYIVGEGGGIEMFVPSSSPLSASVSASRARFRTSSAASRFAGRQTGGPVVPGGGTLLGGPSFFNPPSSGQIVPAAQTAALMGSQQQAPPVVVQSAAPNVQVTTQPQIVVNGRVFREAIRGDDQVQAEIVDVTRKNQDGISQGS